MILELADIRIPPGKQAEFEEAIQRGVETQIAKAKGFRSYQVKKSIESPERYLLMIYWDAVEDHMVGFRESPQYLQWRAIIGQYLAVPPIVEHFSVVAESA